ncbi:plasmid mobilization relaxosome protein MobC [Nocardia sp. 852002-51244_SCH5132740]|uniref:plasmid mobilization relaxosome protein MobC n=1 Tax=Nocardia sp. 852002-51244_SCH5132740 TaxID=1834099 RepID=UPI0009EEF005|nr:plasmid mobilization relaxosome protein MobC [Nocardia sp. 852002-51244_SCH5132740]
MAGESANRRARVRRERQANVAGGRPHRTVVKLSDAEQTELSARAAAAGVSVPRYLVDTAMGRDDGEPGRAAAVGAILDLDEQVRRIGNNINQLTRYAHQHREVSEEIVPAFRAFVRMSLLLDETARWVMGKAPAVALDAEALDVVELPSGHDDPDSWATQIDG